MKEQHIISLEVIKAFYSYLSWCLSFFAAILAKKGLALVSVCKLQVATRHSYFSTKILGFGTAGSCSWAIQIKHCHIAEEQLGRAPYGTLNHLMAQIMRRQWANKLRNVPSEGNMETTHPTVTQWSGERRGHCVPAVSVCVEVDHTKNTADD